MKLLVKLRQRFNLLRGRWNDTQSIEETQAIFLMKDRLSHLTNLSKLIKLKMKALPQWAHYFTQRLLLSSKSKINKLHRKLQHSSKKSIQVDISILMRTGIDWAYYQVTNALIFLTVVRRKIRLPKRKLPLKNLMKLKKLLSSLKQHLKK